jgi:hypothetical protein
VDFGIEERWRLGDEKSGTKSVDALIGARLKEVRKRAGLSQRPSPSDWGYLSNSARNLAFRDLDKVPPF